MVGILLSYWGGLFSGATLVSGRVVTRVSILFAFGLTKSYLCLKDEHVDKHVPPWWLNHQLKSRAESFLLRTGFFKLRRGIIFCLRRGFFELLGTYFFEDRSFKLRGKKEEHSRLPFFSDISLSHAVGESKNHSLKLT